MTHVPSRQTEKVQSLQVGTYKSKVETSREPNKQTLRELLESGRSNERSISSVRGQSLCRGKRVSSFIQSHLPTLHEPTYSRVKSTQRVTQIYHTNTVSSESEIQLVNESIKEYQGRDLSQASMSLKRAHKPTQNTLTESLQNIYKVTTSRAYELGEGIVKKITKEQPIKPMMTKENANMTPVDHNIKQIELRQILSQKPSNVNERTYETVNDFSIVDT